MSNGALSAAQAEPSLKKPSFWTPFNLISIPIMVAGVIILVIRFTQGLGSVTNLNQEFPWGFWIGFDVVTGVAFAGGAYVITFTVYVMRSRKYMPIVRVTVLNGLLAYIFYAGALVLDLGRPWNIINPIIGNDFGYNSVLFLVAWHFMLYMMAEFVEFSPVVAEWLGWRRVRKVLHSLTLAAVIFGVTLSTLHQSGLGALFLLAKSKIHPLWYTEFIPILFFVSSIFAGMSMIIVEGTISHRVLRDRVRMAHFDFDDIIFGLAKGAAITMFAYYFFKLLVFLHEGHWEYLLDKWGLLFVVEVVGLVLVPCILFAFGVRNRRIGIVRFAAVLSLLGVLLNRLNVSIIAFNWYVPNHYYPSWQEIVVTLMIINAEIWVFRWIVTRMPVYDRVMPAANSEKQ
ncbi:MAG: NrfD/PsrC family molybdoenzyme membrane anchor subunit [Rhodothermales bacterium]|nr:NrfD/PsrC family molybdoenzyme membrane anchor subunit [Rhodothermales bacterium]